MRLFNSSAHICLLLVFLIAAVQCQKQNLLSNANNNDDEDPNGDDNSMTGDDDSSGQFNQPESNEQDVQIENKPQAPSNNNQRVTTKKPDIQPKQIEDTGDDSNGADSQDQEESQNYDDDNNEEIVTPEINEQPTSTTQPSANQANEKSSYQSSGSKLLLIITKPGIMAGIVGGAIIGVLTAILLIMFIVYRMRKKDEGSYALEETKKPLNAYDYRHCPTKEFYA